MTKKMIVEGASASMAYRNGKPVRGLVCSNDGLWMIIFSDKVVRIRKYVGYTGDLLKGTSKWHYGEFARYVRLERKRKQKRNGKR